MRDASLNTHLQMIVDRLLGTLPPTQIAFRVQLVDSDEVNGFSIAGGHIYMTRKLAAAARSDDELAGVLGHEIGHIISHQFAFETTREMKRLLGVTGLGDEADIRQKYEAMLDAEYKDKHPGLSETDRDQAEADQIGIYAMASAGYDAAAYSAFWDRTLFVQGKMGSRLGDLLGLTKPSQKRLRSMAAMVAALPGGCSRPNRTDSHEFAVWHQAVIANQASGAGEESAAFQDIKLTPPLHLGLERLRFSPDGKYILAQDASSIFVLDQDPLTVRYRIDIHEAMPANFSPDSQSITFSTPGLHTEQWSVQEKKLLAAHELLPHGDCYDTRLSPDGRSLLCVQLDVDIPMLGLTLLNTDDSATLWEKKGWLSPGFTLGFDLLMAKARGSRDPFFISSYSEDGNVLLFGGGDAKLAFDLKQRTAIKTGGSLKGSITGDYAFVGNDRLAGINRFEPKKSGLYSFPDGRLLQRVSMGFTAVKPVSHAGDAVRMLVYGLKDYQVGLVDLNTDKLLMATKTPALDAYDNLIVAESRGGAVVVAAIGETDASKQRHVMLPLSPLPYYPTAAFSPDGRYLALSAGKYGGVWDATSGKQLAYVHGFSDAAWTDSTTLFMDIPKENEVERHIAKMSMISKSVTSLSYKVTDEGHMRYGQLTEWKQDEKKKTWTLSLYDPATEAMIWNRSFPDRYFTYTASYGNRDLIFNFNLDTHTGKEAVKGNPALAAEANTVKDKKAARLIKVLDAKTGDDVGSLVVELPPNYAGTDGLNRCGDLLYVAGVDDRTAVYSISTGKRLRDVIGYVGAVDAATGRVFTSNRIGEGMVHDAQGLELAHYKLGAPIRFASFREGANLVTILTADQRVRTMQVIEQKVAMEPARQ
jgi:WD40 repeat protein